MSWSTGAVVGGASGMRIACYDVSASQRERLVRFFESSFEKCKHAVGHIAVDFVPLSKVELQLNSSFDIIAVGPGLSLEEALLFSKEISERDKKASIVAIVSEENYSIRTLKRFESHVDEIFSLASESARIVHTLLSLFTTRHQKISGKLCVVDGVKGGVGTTSIVSGLAHAAQAEGKRAIVIDLSRHSVFALYAMAEKKQSPELQNALIENSPLDRVALEKSITVSPNEISIFLPPAGGEKYRQVWLRDESKLEISISAIDMLRETFDLIIVDLANAEGILPYALSAHADIRIIVANNDPAAIHLLSKTIDELSMLPGSAENFVLLNFISSAGLTTSDILNFISSSCDFNDKMILPSIAKDERGGAWIGTGNSFYTESKKFTQVVFEKIVRQICEGENVEQQNSVENISTNNFWSVPRITHRLNNISQLLPWKRMKNVDDTLLKPRHISGLLAAPETDECAALQSAVDNPEFSIVAEDLNDAELYASKRVANY